MNKRLHVEEDRVKVNFPVEEKMDGNGKRTTIFLKDHEHAMVKELSDDLGFTQSEVIRRGVWMLHWYVSQYKDGRQVAITGLAEEDLKHGKHIAFVPWINPTHHTK